MEKTNAEHLRDILNELSSREFGTDPFNAKVAEANEFLDAIEEEAKDVEADLRDTIEAKNTEISELNSTINDLEENPDTEEFFVGLDTLYIGYQNRNIKIQSDVESFIKRLQLENSVVPA